MPEAHQIWRAPDHAYKNYIFAMYYYLEGKRKYMTSIFIESIHFTGIWSDVAGGSIHSRELKQPRRRRLRKRQLKNVFAQVQTSLRPFISFNSSNVGEFVWSWILKDCIKVQEKQKRVVVLCSRAPKKREIRQFHVVGKEMYKKRVMDVRRKRGRCWGALQPPPPPPPQHFCRIINVFLLFYYGQLIRT